MEGEIRREREPMKRTRGRTKTATRSRVVVNEPS